MSMADFGRNFIDMYGNQAVKDLTAEVNRRLKLSDPQTAIGEVFYGLPHEKAGDIEQLTGSSWVSHASSGEFGDDDQILLTSDTDIPEKLENHLVWFYSKIDPDVVLRNKYDSEDGNFVGIRYKLVRNGKIFTFHRHKSIWASVVFEINEEDEDDQITWEDLWDIQHDLIKQARADLLTEYPLSEKYVGL
jgi:hypothetical protein